ncbi:MAG: PAS domain-containing protein [Alphaproteobacteria bacterium]|nr:PAS domain-containing protein [Alphaproteobacteria bacterium]
MTDPAAPLDAASLRFNATGAADGPEPQSPALLALLRYWQSKCKADGRLPGRSDLDPLELRTLLPHIYLIDVLPGTVPDRWRFRVRLLGEKHVEVYGPGMVGKVIDDVFPPAVAAEFNRLYATVVRRRGPVVNRGRVSWLRNKEWLEYEGMHAPLASDGVTIDCIFGTGAFVGLD